MKIRYVWPQRKHGEAHSIELLDEEHVPRVGELVDISIQITADEWCYVMGRVKDVIWCVRREPMVSVLLGAA